MTEAGIEAQRRPRSREKLRQMLTAAGRLFRAHGYGATSMDNVSRDADVSKATLYAYFPGKRELFAAVIAAEDTYHSRSWASGEAAKGDIRARLLHIGRSVFELLLAPETIETHRMVAAEATRFPDLGRAYYENGAARLLLRLDVEFASAMVAGRLRKADSRRAAEQFIGLIRGDLQLRALLGLDADKSASQIDAVICGGVDTFYRAYAPDDGQGAVRTK
jgi:TetR/AcrR family transcriptional regulator, mexJK operon transcriptional repressor